MKEENHQGWQEWIIVSVDDFGIRDSAKPILELAQAGQIDRVAVLINYLQSEEDARALIKTGVKIDLHLELVQLLGSGEQDGDGAFGRGVNFLWRYVTGRLSVAAVEAEWRLQIEKFREQFGCLPDGLNSHEHVHFFPSFFEAFLKLREEYNITFIRFPRRGLLETRHTLVGRILKFFWRWNRKKYPSNSDQAANWFVSYDWLAESEAFFKRLPEGQTEILFHPERPEEAQALQEFVR